MKEQTLEEKLKALSLDELNKWTISRISYNDPDRRAKLSEAQKGRKLTGEHKAKLSEVHKGRKHTSETRAKMSETRKGKKYSAERCANISKGRKGKVMNDDAIFRMSRSLRKLNDVQSLEIKSKFATGKYTKAELAREYGVSRWVIMTTVNDGHYKKR